MTVACPVPGGSVPIDRRLQLTSPICLGAFAPAYVATNLATSTASWPTTMFCGMYAPEKPPLAIAYRTRSIGRSQRTLKFGPLIACAVRMFGADPCVPAAYSV